MDIELILLQLSEYIRELRTALTQEKSLVSPTFEDRLRFANEEKRLCHIEIAVDIIIEGLRTKATPTQ